IALKLRNEKNLDNYLMEVENPDSPMFHHFISKDEFKNLYSPKDDEFNTVFKYFKDQWNDVTPGPYNLAIFINDVPLWKVQEMFHVKYALFKSLNSHFKEYYFAPLEPVQLPYEIAQYVKGVNGLTNAYNFHINSRLIKNPEYVISKGIQYMTGADLEKAYQVYELYNGTSDGSSSSVHYFPKGYTVATVLWEGTHSSTLGLTQTQVAPFNPSEIQTYFQNVLPKWIQNIVGTINVSGIGTKGTVAPGPSSTNDSYGVVFENTLDLEMAGTLAPGANLICVYGPGKSGGPSETNFPDNEYAIVATLKNLVAVSNSWGDGDSVGSSTTDNYVKLIEANGTAVFASAGDDGDTSIQSYPANDAQNTFGFVAVGGTTLNVNGVAGYLNAAGTSIINTIKSQIVWYDNGNVSSNGDHWGTTSGTSTAYPIPSWQNIPAVINNGGSTSGRNVADVAAIGNNTIVYLSDTALGYSAGYYGIAGTSVASPVVAGIVATMVGYLNQKFGYIDPLFYKVGANNTLYKLKPFWDVTQTPANYHSGQTLYWAKPGWDYATGWGSINAWNFTHRTITFTETGLPAGTKWYVNFTDGETFSSTTNTISAVEKVGLSTTYKVANITVGNYVYVPSPQSGNIAVGWSDISINIVFAKKTLYTVTFTESGLPPGTTWSVTLGGTTKSSSTNTITFSEPNGTYTFSVGVISGYTASPSSGTITVNGANVNQGITFTQNVTKLYTITFTESGLPAGTKWYVNLSNGQSFSSTTNTITFSEPNGTYSYTIATVNKNYAPNPSSGTFTVNGNNVNVAITFNLVTYTVTFTESGLPAGTTWSVTLGGTTKSSST
ncbi:MAG: protease pro-enzyme activation domain-containing protein, partial [bacterium]